MVWVPEVAQDLRNTTLRNQSLPLRPYRSTLVTKLPSILTSASPLFAPGSATQLI